MVAVIFTVPAFFAVSLPSASTDTTLLFELFQTGATEAFNTTMDRLSPPYSLPYPACICKDV